MLPDSSTVEEQFSATGDDAVAIKKACDLLAHYYLVKAVNNVNDTDSFLIYLEQTVLDACTHWVSSVT